MKTLHTFWREGEPSRENRTPPNTVMGAPSVRIGVLPACNGWFNRFCIPQVDLPSPPEDMLSKQVHLRIPRQPVLVGRIIELLPAAPQVHTQHPHRSL